MHRTIKIKLLGLLLALSHWTYGRPAIVTEPIVICVSDQGTVDLKISISYDRFDPADRSSHGVGVELTNTAVNTYLLGEARPTSAGKRYQNFVYFRSVSTVLPGGQGDQTPSFLYNSLRMDNYVLKAADFSGGFATPWEATKEFRILKNAGGSISIFLHDKTQGINIRDWKFPKCS